MPGGKLEQQRLHLKPIHSEHGLAPDREVDVQALGRRLALVATAARPSLLHARVAGCLCGVRR